ncbi:MAG: hypothetical protein CMF96_01340 [Candidatus Marinimicrobia bacterium]|nr:hypothetical protein [Candidatus Neomarinimicrobiota bacterium]
MTNIETKVQKLIEEMESLIDKKQLILTQIKSILVLTIKFFKENDLFNKYRDFFQMMVNKKRVIVYQTLNEFFNRMQNIYEKMTYFSSLILGREIKNIEVRIGNSQIHTKILLLMIHYHILHVNVDLIEFNQKKANQIFDVSFNGVKFK